MRTLSSPSSAGRPSASRESESTRRYRTRARRDRRWPWAPPGAAARARRPGRPYADGENTGSAVFCANRVRPRGYIVSLRKRDPSGQLVVVIGASHASSFAAKRTDLRRAARSATGAGAVDRAPAPGAPRAPTKGALVVNGPRHQRSHRRVVRAGTPVARTAAIATIVVGAIALATTTAPTYAAAEEPNRRRHGPKAAPRTAAGPRRRSNHLRRPGKQTPRLARSDRR